VLLVLVSAPRTAPQTTPPQVASQTAQEKKDGGGQCGGGLRYDQKVPGTSIALTMLAVPPGEHPKLWISSTEVPWEAYDAFVFGFDKKDPTLPKGAEAAARPSQPYITMDHSFGHAGYPVISVSSLGAASFCEWLSKATGCKYRLPTEAEWESAARADGAQQDLDAIAWTKANAEKKTHPIGTKTANAWGFRDMLGNAAEWCTAKEGIYVVRGGSYRDGPEGASVTASLPSDPAWNKSDPQIPKSKWWLADGGFVGFRIAREE
jgi:formylglycine-generating enzyme required for sulfatase activity